MFKIGEIRELIRLLDETAIHEICVENEGAKLHIKKADPVAPTIVEGSFAGAAPAPAYIAQTAVKSEPVVAATTPVAAKSAEVETASNPVAENLHTIVSPMVGTFYRAPSPEAGAFVEVGAKVSEKTVVCIVEAMKLMNEIEAEVKGEVVDVLAENGQLVEYGQPLFRIKLG